MILQFVILVTFVILLSTTKRAVAIHLQVTNHLKSGRHMLIIFLNLLLDFVKGKENTLWKGKHYVKLTLLLTSQVSRFNIFINQVP